MTSTQKFVTYLESAVKPGGTPTGRCGHFIAAAMKAAGVKVPDGVIHHEGRHQFTWHDGRRFAEWLPHAGFREISQAGPFQPGDIAVFLPTLGLKQSKHGPNMEIGGKLYAQLIYGHVQAYTGPLTGWISDFRQRDIFPGDSYNPNKNPRVVYKVYRSIGPLRCY